MGLNRREAARAAGRRRAARFGTAILVGGIAFAGYQWWQGSRPTPTWVGAPVSAGPAVTFDAPPDAYRVVSRVEAGNPIGTTVRTEVLEVRRPWEGKLTTLEGPPPGGDVTDVLIGGFGRLDVRPTNGQESALVVSPELAPSDLRLDVGLDALVEAGAIDVRERRVVDGEPCQVLRTTAPPQGQSIDVITAGGEDLVESCVDRHGIIREQLQWFQGELLLRRRAVEVDLEPELDDGDFTLRERAAAPQGYAGGLISEVALEEGQEGISYVLDDAPRGFRSDGRWAIAPSQPPRLDGTEEGNRRSAFVDVWRDGADVVFLEQGGLQFGGDALGELPLSSPVDLGDLGEGEAAPGARLSHVTLRLDGGRYVRLQGTLPVAQLVELMKALRRVDPEGSGPG